MADKITQLQKELGTIIKGKKEVTDKIIMAVLARGHVLLEDVQHAVHGVCRETVLCRKRPHAVKGPVENAVAVDCQNLFHGIGPPFISSV